MTGLLPPVVAAAEAAEATSQAAGGLIGECSDDAPSILCGSSPLSCLAISCDAGESGSTVPLAHGESTVTAVDSEEG